MIVTLIKTQNLKKKKNKQTKHWYPVMTAGPIVDLFIYLFIIWLKYHIWPWKKKLIAIFF